MPARSGTLSLDENPTAIAFLNEINKLVADLFYASRNRTGTVAPAAAMSTDTLKGKTTNNTTYVRGGAPHALNAADNFWDLSTAGQGVAVVPASSFIKYRLIVTAAEAAKVRSSTVSAAAATCDFGQVPMADGDVILAQLTIATDGAHTFTPNTTALNAAGITATFADGSDGSELLASIRIP